MDIMDFFVKTIFEFFGWIFGLIIRLVTAIIGGLFNLIFSKSND